MLKRVTPASNSQSAQQGKVSSLSSFKASIENCSLKSEWNSSSLSKWRYRILVSSRSNEFPEVCVHASVVKSEDNLK